MNKKIISDSKDKKNYYVYKENNSRNVTFLYVKIKKHVTLLFEFRD